MAKIRNKAPGISMSGDVQILQTNTSRAIKELHGSILELERQNIELRGLVESLSKTHTTTEVEDGSETKTADPGQTP